MMMVVAVLITVIWLLFAIFLQNFYEFAKEGEVKKSQKQYITMLENSSPQIQTIAAKEIAKMVVDKIKENKDDEIEIEEENE